VTCSPRVVELTLQRQAINDRGTLGAHHPEIYPQATKTAEISAADQMVGGPHCPRSASRLHQTRLQAGSTPTSGFDLRCGIECEPDRAHSGHICLRPAEGIVERVAGTAGGLRDQVTIQVDGGRNGLMSQPAGDFRDRDALGECRAGKRMS